MTPKPAPEPGSTVEPGTVAIAPENHRSSEDVPPDQRQSIAEDLLQFVGTWQGDDLEECLDIVYATRSVWYP